MRIKIFHIFVILLFVLVVCGLFFLQIIRGSYYYRLSNSNRIRLIPQEAERGIIYDRNGAVVADNKISFDVALVPQDLGDAEKTFNYLSVTLDKDRNDVLREFRLNRWTPFAPAKVARNIPRETAIKLEEVKDLYPGMVVQIRAQRFYPFGPACSHILGYLGQIDRSRITRLKDYGYKIKDIIGYAGVEEYYDNFLRGEDGGTQIEVDNLGRQVRLLGMRQPQKGRDLILTVDSRMQKIAYAALENRRGAAVFMEPDSGEIFCMVSSPSFNPNAFIDRSDGDLLRNYFSNSASPLLNRVTQGLYPPGSVFKIITAIAALETGKINYATSFVCKGSFTLGNREFLCSEIHGLQNLKQALTHSCNVYFYHTGLMVGSDALNRYAREFGLGVATGIDLPSEVKGLVPSRLQKKISKNENWFEGDTVNFSIGQGDVLTTPLQLTRLMAILLTGYSDIRPHLVKKVGDREIDRGQLKNRLKIKPEYLEQIEADLRSVVADPTGTANVLNLPNLKVAGKTGTAQVGGGRSHAWFVGFFPSDKPRMVFCVFLENGGSSYNACVVARRILEEMVAEDIL
jgi:penicillin-binding protein 2